MARYRTRTLAKAYGRMLYILAAPHIEKCISAMFGGNSTWTRYITSHTTELKEGARETADSLHLRFKHAAKWNAAKCKESEKAAEEVDNFL